ncbi:MAG: hypothetical protein RR539_07945 [Clostridium sp.]|uniref:DUF7922 domain-containing protein n=1 Tax=Clostridium sp. TaxID=1506 RepID=UPI002FC90510
MSKKYNRSFLIFNEEDKGFEVAGDKQPTGYTKLESKNGVCKITVFAQNLKAEKGPYCCYLVDSSKSPAIVARLGELNVDKSGKGETIWEQDNENIKGTGLTTESFNVAAVVKEGNRLQVPLAGYAGKDRSKWRDKITSESFVSSNNNGDLSGESDDSYTEPSVKDQINRIVEKAESEVIAENREIVNSTRVNASDKDTIKDQISQIVEQAENDVLRENRDLVDETRALLNLDSDEDEIFEDARDFVSRKGQLQRDDNDYVESYSREGYEFLHYESDINLLSEDSMYADNMTREEDGPSVKKMIICPNDDILREDICSNSQDDCIDDSCDNDFRDSANSISNEDGILARAMARANIDRHNMCHELKADLNKLENEIELEFKKFLERELRKYKQTMLKYICDQDKSLGHHHGHCEGHHHHGQDECKCEKKHDCDWHDYKHNHKDDFHHHGHFDGGCQDMKDTSKSKEYAKALHCVLKDYEKVEVKGAKGCKFWKVDMDASFPDKDNKMYPYYSAIQHLKMTYPYINYIKYFKCKGYYHFGIKYDNDGGVKYLIYGIAGDKKESHQPYKGMTGFVSWTPHQNSGIWLMYYNPFTGCVMLPKGKEKKKKK